MDTIKNNSDSNEEEYINSAEAGTGNSDDENDLPSDGDGDMTSGTPDFDHYCKVSYLERFYDDILSEHHGHNKGLALRKQCAKRFCNISKTRQSSLSGLVLTASNVLQNLNQSPV